MLDYNEMISALRDFNASKVQPNQSFDLEAMEDAPTKSQSTYFTKQEEKRLMKNYLYKVAPWLYIFVRADWDQKC